MPSKPVPKVTVDEGDGSDPLAGLSPDQVKDLAASVGISAGELGRRRGQPWVKSLVEAAFPPAPAAPSPPSEPTSEPPTPPPAAAPTPAHTGTKWARPGRYDFEAMDVNGNEAGGSVPAKTEDEAAKILQGMGLFVTKLTEVIKHVPAMPDAAGGGKAGAVAAEGAGLAEVAGAAAGGPAGAALAAASLAADQLAGKFQAVGKVADAAGQGMQQLARNDAVGMVGTAANAAADSLEEIPVVGKVYAEGIRAATKVVQAYTETVDAFVARGRELGFASGQLASANATADVRSYQADVREAKALEDPLSRLTDNSSQTDTNVRELLLPIKEAVVDMLASVSEVTSGVTGIAKEFAPVLKAILNVVTFLPAETLKLLGTVLKQISDYLKKLEIFGAADDPDPPIMDWLNAADNLGRDSVAIAPDDRRAAAPIFGM